MTAVDPLLAARARTLNDLEATGVADPATVSLLEEAVADRRAWLAHWAEGAAYVAGLVAQDLQDALLETHGRWPLCPRCEDATHAVYVQPDLGGPDPVWFCEESGVAVAPLGGIGQGGGCPPPFRTGPGPS